MINSGDKIGNASGWRRAAVVKMERGRFKKYLEGRFPRHGDGPIMEKEDLRDSFKSSDILQFLSLLHV